jgi:hypothetical protein
MGHYPTWNENEFKDVVMQKELAFQPDMKVSLYNVK